MNERERLWLELYRLLEQGATLHPRLLQDAESQRGPLGESFLHWVVLEGSAETVSRLLVAGVAVDRRNHLGNTALMEAAANGRWDVVRVLLEGGADRSLRNHDDECLEDYLELHGLELPDDLKA